jgi:hypothetical protein
LNDEIEAATQTRAPIVPHLSESWHRTAWETFGGKGDPPVAFRHRDTLFVDYERLSPAMRRAIGDAMKAGTPGSGKSGGVP